MKLVAQEMVTHDENVGRELDALAESTAQGSGYNAASGDRASERRREWARTPWNALSENQDLADS